jgi:hypothetical protein
MYRIFDRRTQRTLGTLDAQEFASFQQLLQQPANDDELPTIDPAALEGLQETGASANLRLMVRQVVDGSDWLDLGWEPSTDS